MASLTDEEQGNLIVNAEYQKVITFIMSLTTGSFVLPGLFLKDFIGLPEHASLMNSLDWRVWASWGLLLLALLSGLVYSYASAKFVKAVYKHTAPKETRFEKYRDLSVWFLIVFFALGLIFILFFIFRYDDIEHPKAQQAKDRFISQEQLQREWSRVLQNSECLLQQRKDIGVR
jgi:hypothetical protein